MPVATAPEGGKYSSLNCVDSNACTPREKGGLKGPFENVRLALLQILKLKGGAQAFSQRRHLSYDYDNQVRLYESGTSVKSCQIVAFRRLP